MHARTVIRTVSHWLVKDEQLQSERHSVIFDMLRKGTSEDLVTVKDTVKCVGP